MNVQDAEEEVKRGARERVAVAESTSELAGRRPLGPQQQLLASLEACSPSQNHSSVRCRGLVGRWEWEGAGAGKPPSAVASEGAVWKGLTEGWRVLVSGPTSEPLPLVEGPLKRSPSL